MTPTDRSKHTLWLALAGLVVLGAAGPLGCSGAEQDDEPLPKIEENEPQPTPKEGKTSFASAAASNGEESEDNKYADGQGAESDADNRAGAAPGGSEPQRTVEEGDIYQVIDHSNQILNLNRYRGLQVVDFSDPTKPSVIGRARIHGRPVEMYQVGDQVYALLNNWRGYYQSKTELTPETYRGGVVAVIDISDPTAPKVTERVQIPGYIQTSRLTRGQGKEALFVVASSGRYSNGRYHGETHVRSFAVSGKGQLKARSKLDLGGRVQDINAMSNRLLVAREQRDSNRKRSSEVSIIDISDPTGKMVEGDKVTVKGIVQNKHNLHYHEGVLRVVSGASWRSSRTNHVETFDATDIQTLKPIDHDSFGKDMRLEATLFMDNRAFFVTYRRVDPFHAFTIDKNGKLDEKNEFIVSGWNDYFVPVADGKRLIGIGKNDQNGRTMAVSLYDITDLTLKKPMITREEIDLRYSHSEANRDDRAFSVLENATAIKASGGTVETGLILLPYQGYNDKTKKYESGVQVFTFSESTLTLRGTMDHGTPVRRSFMAERSKNLTANLSEAELSFFDTGKPDAPAEKGRVDLAPTYDRFFTFGSYGVRRDTRRRYYYWWGQRGNQQKQDALQVVKLSDTPDTADPVTEISIPAGAEVVKSGSHLVVLDAQRTEKTRKIGYRDRRVWTTDITVWDFSTPTAPKPVQTLTTDKLHPSYHYGYYRDYGYGCPTCSVGGAGGADAAGAPAEAGADRGGAYAPYRMSPQVVAGTTSNAVVFLNKVPARKKLGTHHRIYTRPHDDLRRWQSCRKSSGGYKSNCTYYTGREYCYWTVKTDGSKTKTECSGSFRKCTVSQGHHDCKKVGKSAVPRTETSKSDYPSYDHWVHYEVFSLDLSDASKATMHGPVTMPKTERDIDHLVAGDSLYVTHRKPYNVPSDSRDYVKYFFKEVNLSNPAKPKAGKSVNIPGRLLSVDGDELITRDYLWGKKIVETSINRLVLNGGKAHLKASHRLKDRRVRHLALDGAGHVMVSHRLAYHAIERSSTGSSGSSNSGSGQEPDRSTYLSLLNLKQGLKKVGETKIADWASLKGATKQRALFQVPGGLLVVDARTPTSPIPQAFFPTQGWPHRLTVDGNDVYMASGRYGIYEFDLTTTNLLLP